jgi:putative acetyltransferase
LQITRTDFDDPQVLALLRLHLSEALANSPPGTSYALDLTGLQVPELTLWTAWDDGVLAGMGALKTIGPAHGEIKSMRTAQSHLRRGVASLILQHLLAQARQAGLRRVSLETGTTEDYAPAVALYRRAGFTPGAIFGEYRPSDFNLFMHLDL